MLNFLKTNKRIIIIILFPFVLYGGTITNEYNLDDDFVIENNEQVQKGIKGIPEIFKTRYTNRKGLSYEYRPITKSYFAILYSVFGNSPKIFHFLSIVLFSILALLILKLLKLIFKDIKEDIVFVAILLFVSYPANTEVVASLKNNEQLFSSIFSVLSFIFLLKYIDNNKIKNLVFSSLALFTGVISKLDAIIFIPIMVASLVYFRKISLKKALVLSLSIIVLYSLFRLLKTSLPKSDRIITFIENPLYINNDISTMVSTGFASIVSYIEKIIYPFNLKFYYGYKEFTMHYFNEAIVWFGILLILSLISLSIYLYKKNRIISFVVFALLINIFAYSNIYKPLPSVFADRFLFVSSMFFAILVSYSLFKIKQKYITYILLISVIISYSFKTINRGIEWKNRKTLYSADISKLYNTSAKANEVYAIMLMGELNNNNSNKVNSETLKLAEKHFEKCIEIYPYRYTSLNNLGLINFMYYKKYNKALEYFEKAKLANPDTNDIKIYYNLGLMNQLLKKFPEAIEYYNFLLAKDSSYINVYYNLADIYVETKDLSKAIDYNLLASKLSPKSDKPYINIGKIYFYVKDTAMSIEYLKKAYKVNPNNKLTTRVLKEYKIIP